MSSDDSNDTKKPTEPSAPREDAKVHLDYSAPREWTLYTLRAAGGRGYMNPHNCVAGPLLDGEWADCPGYGNMFQMCGSITLVEKSALDAANERIEYLEQDLCLPSATRVLLEEKLKAAQAEVERLKEYKEHIYDYVQATGNTSPKTLGYHVAQALVMDHKDLKERCERLEKSFVHNPQEGLVYFNGETWVQLSVYDKVLRKLGECVREREDWKAQAIALAGALECLAEFFDADHLDAIEARKRLAAFEKFKEGK